MIEEILSRHYRTNGKWVFLTEVTTSSVYNRYWRFDGVAIKKSYCPWEIRGFEVKRTRSDFVNDTKWPEYLKFCNRFFWVCPEGLIDKKEISVEAGLIWINEKKRVARTKKLPPYRQIELPGNLLLSLIINRCGSDEHPFYSTRREYLEDWVNEKRELKELGGRVGDRLRHIKLKATREVEAAKNDLKLLEDIKHVLKSHDIHVEARWGYWERDLEKMLTPRVNGDVKKLQSLVMGAIAEWENGEAQNADGFSTKFSTGQT